MTDSQQYTPGPASGAQVRKEGEKWTLILVRELGHPPEKVWQALTDPAHLREWAPFEVDGSLGTVGTVKLTWVGTPTAIDFISMGAAGWHIAFDVLNQLLAGQPIARMVGAEAMKFAGWQRLNAEYAKQFGIEPPRWPPQAAQKS